MTFQAGRPSRRRAFQRALALGLASAGALLAACQQPTSPLRSGDARPAGLPTPEPTPVAKTAPASLSGPGKPAPDATMVAGPPRPGGSIICAVDADPVSLDPHGAGSAGSVQVWGDIACQSLVMFDDGLKIVPCLAEAWANTSPTTWTFTLRRGVRWHDGSLFEAEDVRFWHERLTASGTAAPFRSWFSRIANVEPRGASEVRFTLDAPYAPFLASFAAMRGSAMAPREWLQRAGAVVRSSAVGSGPFKIAEYVPRSHVRYVKHADYWERGLPYLDEVVLTIIPDEDARAAELGAGRLSQATFGAAAAQRFKGDKRFSVLSSPGPIQWMTYVNAARKPFDDLRVRQAVGVAIDRRAAIDRLLGGGGQLTGPMPPGHGDWAIPPSSLPYRVDPAEAKRLLGEAGYPDGFEATVKAASDQPLALALATLMAEQLRPLGVTLKIERLDGPSMRKAVEARDFALAMHRNDFLPDPDHYFSMFASGEQGPGSDTPTGWANGRFDELVGQARASLDPGRRKLLYDEAAGLLLSEAPAIWWLAETSHDVIQSSLKAYSPSFTGLRSGLKRAWLER